MVRQFNLLKLQGKEDKHCTSIMENKAKKCIECGKTLTLDHFRRTPLSPDGYAKACKLCANSKRTHGKNDDRNPALINFKARELIDELRARGYRGTLRITKDIQV